MHDSNAVLLSGYAKLPTNITAEVIYNTLVVAVLVDKRSGVIIDAEVSMVTELSKRFVAELLRGYNLNDGPEGLIMLFEDSYLGNARKALETAVRSIFVKYQDYMASRTSERSS